MSFLGDAWEQLKGFPQSVGNWWEVTKEDPLRGLGKLTNTAPKWLIADPLDAVFNTDKFHEGITNHTVEDVSGLAAIIAALYAGGSTFGLPGGSSSASLAGGPSASTAAGPDWWMQAGFPTTAQGAYGTNASSMGFMDVLNSFGNNSFNSPQNNNRQAQSQQIQKQSEILDQLITEIIMKGLQPNAKW